MDPQETERTTGSPATALTLVLGLLGLVTALNAGAFAVSLFFSLAALAALPMALADRPGASSLRFALLGGGSAVLALGLVLVPLLTSEDGRAERNADPTRTEERPVTPGAVPGPSAAPTPG